MEMIPKDIPYKDRSEFLRGFMILIRQNNLICKYERNMTIVIGRYFGFNEEFCEESINSLLENEYISEEPAVFSDSIIAKYFINMAKNILQQIHPLSESEMQWLDKTAQANNISIPVI